ncbi:hypothetical protein BDN72DRAFT_845357 [Pluteus cervinus]|uniref:Uncharacterized protein n=1 Tax=Pluteus cervinus TaxID=181527 RepID=A0ACD3AI37_9AGAR|nr:hypothetical protein BDN72DRAFT_845357 [Pluteus cervinus]
MECGSIVRTHTIPLELELRLKLEENSWDDCRRKLQALPWIRFRNQCFSIHMTRNPWRNVIAVKRVPGTPSTPIVGEIIYRHQMSQTKFEIRKTRKFAQLCSPGVELPLQQSYDTIVALGRQSLHGRVVIPLNWLALIRLGGTRKRRPYNNSVVRRKNTRIRVG